MATRRYDSAGSEVIQPAKYKTKTPYTGDDELTRRIKKIKKSGLLDELAASAETVKLRAVDSNAQAEDSERQTP